MTLCCTECEKPLRHVSSMLLPPNGDRVCMTCYDKLHRKENKMIHCTICGREVPADNPHRSARGMMCEPCKTVLVTRDEVKWFAGRMEDKLQANDDKGGWEDCGRQYLLDRMENELSEMIDQASKIGWSVIINAPQDPKDVENLVDECADIANFAMMIADNARKAGGKK